MKPIRLSISAFGAFSEQVEVDFAALAPRGLFLVSGETGTGKTTIFDAMCWALYGTMPLKEPHEVRSDHIDASKRCEVAFTFDTGSGRYTVTRNPEQLRPASNNPKRMVKEAGAATVVRVPDDGGQSELLANKVSEVSRTCEALIGLDAKQFQRVILLPQGEFNKFLLANSGDREKILERLFGGEIYDRIVDELKATRVARQSEVGDVESAIAAALDSARKHVETADAALGQGDEHENADGLPGDDAPDSDESSLNVEASLDDEVDDEPLDRDALGAGVARSQVALERCRTELEAATDQRTSAQTAHDAAVTGARRFDDAGALRTRVADLGARAEAVEADRIAATVSARARPIIDAADALDAAEKAHRDAMSARDERTKSIVEALTEIGAPSDDLDPLALQRQLAERQTAHAADTEKLRARRAADDALANATKARAELEIQVKDAETSLTAAATRVWKIDERLPDVRAAAIDPDTIRAAIETAEQLAEARATLDRLGVDLVPFSERRAAAAEDHRRVLQNFTETQAPRLALTLESGEACPVCGSTEHPSAAAAGDTEVVGWDEVAAAAGRLTDADTAVRELESQITGLRGRLGDSVAIEVAVLHERVGEQRTSLQRATTAAAELTSLEDEHKKLTAETARLTTETGRLGEAHEQATRNLAQAEEAVHHATEAAAGIEPEVLDRRASVLNGFGDALDGYVEHVDAVTSTASLSASRHGDLTKQLQGSEHADVVAARAVVWAPDKEQAALAAAEKHRSECDGALGALHALEAEGVPDERPDPTVTDTALQRADADKKRLETLVATVEFNLDGATTALDDSDRLAVDSGDLRIRADDAARAHQVCAHGGPALQVSLKRWVLAHELDRITASANMHLAGMTNGRYGLRRVQVQRDGRRSFGLDLEIDDTNTGRPRSTSSLSGGEQFQASLALALGLADVISHGGTAGGQAFEALFVDEGFGSLSAGALDDAVETLYRLHGTGRMVGAITHVEAMKQALHVGIEVTRRDDGRGSTLTVNY